MRWDRTLGPGIAQVDASERVQAGGNLLPARRKVVLQFADLADQLIARDRWAALGEEDLRVMCIQQLFRHANELFVQFLAGAEARKDELDIPTGLVALEADHLLGEVGDAYLFPHIQNENLALICE